MAYLDLQNAFSLGTRDLTTQAPRVRKESASLSPLEWLTVAIAERDRPSSLRAPGRFASLMGALFGSRRSSGLANPRLEALRRIAVLLRQQGDAVDAGEISAFFSAGYSRAHFDLVAASIEKARDRRNRSVLA